MKKSIYIILAIALIASLNISAQVDSIGMPAEKVEVIKRYEASILQARKKKISFEIEENKRPPISYNYNVTTEKVIDFERPDPEIRALGYKGDPVTNQDLKDGYIYGAYGTHQTINAGAAYHYYIEDWLDAGLRVDHISAQEKQASFYAPSYESKLRKTEADMYLGYNLGTQTKLSLKGKSDFVLHNQVKIDEVEEDISYNKYGVDLGIAHNVFEDKSFVVRLGGAFDYAKHLLDDEMNNKIFSGNLNVFKTFNDSWSLELPLEYRRVEATRSNPLIEFVPIKRGDLIVEPNLRFKGQNYVAKAGVQYITGDSASYIFPILDVSLPSVVAGIDIRLYTASEYFRNSFYELSELNPYFIVTTADYSPSFARSYNIDISYPLKDLNFCLGFSYSQFDNAVNFHEVSLASRRGHASYLDRDQFSINPSISYNLNETVNVNLNGQYNFFLDESKSEFLTYVPKFALNLTSEQKLFDSKLILSQGLVYNSSREYFQPIFTIPKTLTVDSFWDLSFKATYRLSSSFELFAKGTNLLAAEYYVWHRQDVFQQQIWGGLKFRI